jgi:hypothetical protein
MFAAAVVLSPGPDALSLEDVRRLVLDGRELAADADVENLTPVERVALVNTLLPIGTRFVAPAALVEAVDEA